MFKKVSYLAAVSMLATTLMSSTSHAIFEDELIEVINNFRIQQNNKLVNSQKENVNQEKSSLFSSLWNSSTQALSSGLRTLGGYIRDENSISGGLLFDKGVKEIGNVGTLAISTTFQEAQKKDGFMNNCRKNTGNFLRWAGTKIGKEPTPTLERKIFNFWTVHNEKNHEDVFTSTACALFLSKEIKGTDDIKNSFGRFMVRWNDSSQVQEVSHDHAYEYYVKGIIRGIVKKNQNAETLTQNLAISLGINLEKLSITKSITTDSIVEVPEGKTKEAMVKELREIKFSLFVKEMYELEKLKKESDEERSKLINNENNNNNNKNEIIVNNNKIIKYTVKKEDDKNDKEDKDDKEESNMDKID